ncbi:MAG: hypothetical protein ISS28_07415 [Candidatus Cloacimonetes bacterium]|nr:hypothetical protein [Candidatus Cloacimonadota bacterium]MBL7086903.1 hypothetical protein [Candidatus Cloacimonadota bacterium]
MTKIQYKYFSDLFTNLGHIVIGSFVINNILTNISSELLILGGISALYLYFLGFITLST